MIKALLLVPVTALCCLSCSEDPSRMAGRTGRIDDPLQTTSVLGAAVHSAMETPELPGIYTGVLPCADCPGIEVKLSMKADRSYRLEQRYQGGDSTFVQEGKWSVSGDVLQLNGIADAPDKYLVEDRALVMLGMDGARVRGANEDSYILKKQE